MPKYVTVHTVNKIPPGTEVDFSGKEAERLLQRGAIAPKAVLATAADDPQKGSTGSGPEGGGSSTPGGGGKGSEKGDKDDKSGGKK